MLNISKKANLRLSCDMTLVFIRYLATEVYGHKFTAHHVVMLFAQEIVDSSR